MESADVSKELLCSFCKNIYTDPVTLRCGHNFCRVCIDRVLNTEDESGVYSCPECRAEFQERPTLQRNITLCNTAERLQSTQPHQEEITGIRCTYCIHAPVPAVVSCLLCEASLCDNHLRVHSKSAEHVLTDPSTSLEKKKCFVHKELLKYYCTEDAVCICVSCSLAGEHRGHLVEMLDEASEKKKEKLRNVPQKLIAKREKTEKRVQSLEERWRKDQEKASGEVARVTALFIDIRRRLDDLEKNVLSEISRREEQVSLSLSDVIQKLEIKKTKLTKKMKHIEELCNRTDPLTVLQDPDTGDLSDPEEDRGDEDMGGHDGGDEDMGGHGGEEDTGGRDKTHDIDVDGMIHAGIADIMTYLQTISPIKPKETRKRPHSAQSPPSHTRASPSYAQALPSHTQALPSHTQAAPSQTQASPSHTRASPSHTQASPSHTQASPSNTRASPSNTRASTYWHDDVIVRIGGVEVIEAAAGNPAIYGQGPADILLDVNTADNYLHISDDLKTATWTKVSQNRPETAERFQNCHVMSSQRFTSGRHYWDVQIRSTGTWSIGMCYPSIDRRGRQSHIGYSNKSWSLCGGLAVRHDSKIIMVINKISINRVRICLDYDAGRLSFYELCDPIRHLRTVTATFTEPLHAALCVVGGCVKILGEQL